MILYLYIFIIAYMCLILIGNDVAPCFGQDLKRQVNMESYLPLMLFMGNFKALLNSKELIANRCNYMDGFFFFFFPQPFFINLSF
jgi:hypothetical protein